MPIYSVDDVFKPTGTPTVTYVRRHSLEKSLDDSLNTAGTLVLLTGPSKSGKSTLYNQLFQDGGADHIHVRGHADFKATELWRKALEEVNFDRISQTHAMRNRAFNTNAKVEGQLSWAWLAKVLGKFSVGLTEGKTESEIRQRILSEPSPDHLLPVLRDLPIFFVLEDFHYLAKDVQKVLLQQWKVFTDNEISGLVVGTSHRAMEVANANRDMVGRIAQIKIAEWSEDELKEIAIKGFRCLRVNAEREIMNFIAFNSAGMPMLTQLMCRAIARKQKIFQTQRYLTDLAIPFRTLCEIFSDIAISRFEASYSPCCERLLGRVRTREEDQIPYNKILATFFLSPTTYAQNINELRRRLIQLPIPLTEMPDEDQIENTIERLEEIQQSLETELLEWDSRSHQIVMKEPAFVFYLRFGRSDESGLLRLLD